MFLSLPLLWLALHGLAMLALGRPLNNGQRIAGGLPPAKPKRLFDATRARGACSPHLWLGFDGLVADSVKLSNPVLP
jgi:hypothetical protein